MRLHETNETSEFLQDWNPHNCIYNAIAETTQKDLETQKTSIVYATRLHETYETSEFLQDWNHHDCIYNAIAETTQKDLETQIAWITPKRKHQLIEKCVQPSS